jgi:hypothetical protein
MRRTIRLVAAGLIALSVSAAAQGPHLAAFDRLSPGSWMLHEIGSTTAVRSICLGDPGQLLQIHHGSTACAHFVVSDGPRTATTSYTCPRTGHGRTTITVEGPTLLRIQTQGLANGAPFDVDYEARRGGSCLKAMRH